MSAPIIQKEHGERQRFRVAYLKINLGLTCDEISQRLKLGVKTVEYHWRIAQLQIRSAARA